MGIYKKEMSEEEYDNLLKKVAKKNLKQ